MNKMNEFVKEWNAAVVKIEEIRKMNRNEIVKDASIQMIMEEVEDKAEAL